MVALLICVFAFGGCYVAGRRSLASGLIAVVGVGYLYGIMRANVPSTLSHFFFDAAVMGLYAAQLFQPITAETRARIRPLLPWVAVLIGWPALLVLIPMQDPMIRLVGLRAHIYFIPFLVLGARLNREDIVKITLWLAAFNIAAFGFAAAEFVIGVEPFYPRNQVTEMIYRSRDIHTSTTLAAFRIPATFANSAAYGSAMVITFPLLLGLWMQKEGIRHRTRTYLMVAAVASGLGVFLCASRISMVAMIIIVLVSAFSGRVSLRGRVAWIGMIVATAFLISTQERLFQRLLTLKPGIILERLYWSVNSTLLHYSVQFPLGNGLGGGGTSIPFFLIHLIRNPRSIENQYGTILLEQGIPGLFFWLGFIWWVMTRRTTKRDDPWYMGRRLVWYAVGMYFALAILGQGLLTGVPFSPLFLMLAGWLVVRQPAVKAPDTTSEAAPAVADPGSSMRGMVLGPRPAPAFNRLAPEQ